MITLMTIIYFMLAWVVIKAIILAHRSVRRIDALEKRIKHLEDKEN